MESVNTLELVIKLVAKTGLFFAKVDGNYSEREKSFLQAYIDQLVSTGGTEQEVREMIGDFDQQVITLEEVVADTREILHRLPAAQARIVKLMLYSYISDIIEIDGEQCSDEKTAFHAWEEAIYG